MLNIGLIGDIKLLEPYTHRARQHQEVHIMGKSSVGTQPSPSSFKLQAPEFNRIELIERSDVLFINKFSLLPFPLICDIVKKSKHIFATSYPDFTPEQINQIIKLADEARCIVHIINPLTYLPGCKWMIDNIRKPASIDIVRSNTEEITRNTLIQILLVLKNFTGLISKKTNASTYISTPMNSEYQYVHLEYNDGSIANFHLIKTNDEPCFKVKIYMQDLFVDLDLQNNNLKVNGRLINVPEITIEDEVDDFINTIMLNRKPTTGLNNYLDANQIYDIINKKNHRFTSV